MSARKRQKIDSSSSSPQLSAVAARRASRKPSHLKQVPNADVKPGFKVNDAVTKINKEDSRNISFAPPEAPETESEVESKDENDGPAATSNLSLSPYGYKEEVLSPSRTGSPESSNEQPIAVLSTFKPNKSNVKYISDGVLSVCLGPGERLVIIGQYEVLVLRGQVTLLGSTLSSFSRAQRVCAPASHSLPVIRCLATDVDGSEIRLCQYDNGLSQLRFLSPLFSKLWNEEPGPFRYDHVHLVPKSKPNTFQILFSPTKESKSYLQPLVSPLEWIQCISNLVGLNKNKTQVVMVCGPKSSGKSTFTKLFTNRILSNVGIRTRPAILKSPGVALLDLDPGQSEYFTPGQLGLIHVRELNFGPPFSHPVCGTSNELIRAHTVGSVSPSADPDLYMACSLNLFEHYRSLLSRHPQLPLIINTPGWIFGTGLEILVGLITKIRPTAVVYMSQNGPSEVVENLHYAAEPSPLFALPSQASEYMTRTSAHLRTMQNMSYFHLNPVTYNSLSWSALPLTTAPPWEVNYSGDEAGILGIMCYGEQPPPHLLSEAINGSLLAVIVIEDAAAIVVSNGVEQTTERHDFSALNDHGAAFPLADVDSDQFTSKYILRTSIEDLPFFVLPGKAAISLDPRHSHSIGLCLVRGIDITHRRLQLLTPIASSTLEEVKEAGKSIVLVSGKFDTPGWAYTEELVRRSVIEKEAQKQDLDDMDIEDENDGNRDRADPGISSSSPGEGFENAPWIQKLKDSQGRGIGSRVWKVRRDLGKPGDGRV